MSELVANEERGRVSFIRPELQRQLNRWRESLAGAAAAALGYVWFTSSTGPLWWVGIVMMVGGLLLAVAGVQRARFRSGAEGPGLVSVDEGQLTYFGPFEGGVIAIEQMYTLSLNPNGPQGVQWEIRSRQGEDLSIPVGAEGADALFDVFAGLPGLKTEEMLASLQADGTKRIEVWRRVDIS